MLSEKLLTFVTGKVTVSVLVSDNQLVISFGWYAPYSFCYTEIQIALETKKKRQKKERKKSQKTF